MSRTGPLVVTAAVIESEDRFLVTRRAAGTHLAGCWEFPGGKCESGETPEDCLRREILEELGATLATIEPLCRVRHSYPDLEVELHFYRCSLAGKPSPLLGQEMRWADRRELKALPFPPADAVLIARLTAEQPEPLRPPEP